MVRYITTTNAAVLDTIANPIVMLDGTVPGWVKRPWDVHYDHHRVGGAPIQLAEIPDNLEIPGDPVIVTTQFDADAAAAAAWVQLLRDTQDKPSWRERVMDSKVILEAIAWDCDHLGVMPNSVHSPYAELARNAVAALKVMGDQIALEMGIPALFSERTEEDRIAHGSECFKRGTEWLMDAALGRAEWPGQRGEAAPYWAHLEILRPDVYARCSMYRGCGILDTRGLGTSGDPRLLVDWVRAHPNYVGSEPYTLTIYDGASKPNAVDLVSYDGPLYAYTLGSVPLHPKGCPDYSTRLGVWEVLQAIEDWRRERSGLPMCRTQWGGRDSVGGSSWRDPMVTGPYDVIDRVLWAARRADDKEAENE